MRIIVLGAGRVGTSIAGMLCRDQHDVTVVDHDVDVADHVDKELDVRVLVGSASQSSVLFQAGAAGADLCLAVTGKDEVNLIGASLAKAMGARRSVARVYAPIFRDLSTFDYQRHFHIDRLLSLEHLTAMELARAIRHPGSVAVKTVGRGELEMQEVEITAETKAVGVPLKELRLPKGVRIGSISREGQLFIAGAEDAIAMGDMITLIGTREEIDDVKEMFEVEPPRRLGVVIAGGGETGYHLAQVLGGHRCAVVVLESNRRRCDFLAEHLEHADVVHADTLRRATLEEERVGSADVFVACTGDDEDNILACVEAKELGAKQVMAVVSRPDYASVVSKLGIDRAVSPRRVVAEQVHGFLNTGPVISSLDLASGSGIHVLEIEVLEGAPITERKLASVDLPSQCLIAAVIREGFARVPGADDKLCPGDTVVALVQDAVQEDTVRMFCPDGLSS